MEFKVGEIYLYYPYKLATGIEECEIMGATSKYIKINVTWIARTLFETYNPNLIGHATYSRIFGVRKVKYVD